MLIFTTFPEDATLWPKQTVEPFYLFVGAFRSSGRFN